MRFLKTSWSGVIATGAIGAGAILSGLLAARVAMSQAAPADLDVVREVMGMKGEMDGDVLRFDLTRNDISPSIKGTEVLPALVAHGYAAFRSQPGMDGQCLAAGEVALLPYEVDPYLDVLAVREGLFDNTGLHNHLLHEQPRLIFHHWVAEGSCEDIARTLVSATRMTALVPQDPPMTAVTGIDTETIDDMLGQEGKDMSGVHEVSIPKETIQNGLSGEESSTFPPAMGAQSVIAYQEMGENRAAIATELAFLPEEASRAVSGLRRLGWAVTAQHNHFTNDDPRLIFVHSFAIGDAIELTQELRQVLDAGPEPGPEPGPEVTPEETPVTPGTPGEGPTY